MWVAASRRRDPRQLHRLAGALTRRGDAEERVFLMGDAVGCSTLDELAEWTIWAERVVTF